MKKERIPPEGWYQSTQRRETLPTLREQRRTLTQQLNLARFVHHNGEKNVNYFSRNKCHKFYWKIVG